MICCGRAKKWRCGQCGQCGRAFSENFLLAKRKSQNADGRKMVIVRKTVRSLSRISKGFRPFADKRIVVFIENIETENIEGGRGNIRPLGNKAKFACPQRPQWERRREMGLRIAGCDA
jgi:hypothetical protein